MGIGVAGCGSSVWMFGPALVSQEHASVVAWMDPDREAARRAAESYGGAVFTEYGEMLRGPDLYDVIVASPTRATSARSSRSAATGAGPSTSSRAGATPRKPEAASRRTTAAPHRHTRLTHQTLHERYLVEGSRATLALECDGQWSPSQACNFTLKRYTSDAGIAGCCTDIPLQPRGGLDRQMREDYSCTRELRCFVDAVREGRKPESGTADDGLRAIEVINAAYISSVENRTVKLPLEAGYDLDEVVRALGAGSRFRA